MNLLSTKKVVNTQNTPIRVVTIFRLFKIFFKRRNDSKQRTPSVARDKNTGVPVEKRDRHKKCHNFIDKIRCNSGSAYLNADCSLHRNSLVVVPFDGPMFTLHALV